MQKYVIINYEFYTRPYPQADYTSQKKHLINFQKIDPVDIKSGQFWPEIVFILLTFQALFSKFETSQGI